MISFYTRAEKLRTTALKSLTCTALLFCSATAFSQSTIPKISVQLVFNLDGGGRNTADGLVAVFAPNFSKALGNEDSYKFLNTDENIAIERYGVNLCIEGRPIIAQRDTLPIKVWKLRRSYYYIKIDAKNFDSTLTAAVRDNYLNISTPINLSGSTAVKMEINKDSASFAPRRYTIVFSTPPPTPVLAPANTTRLPGKGEAEDSVKKDTKGMITAGSQQPDSSGILKTTVLVKTPTRISGAPEGSTIDTLVVKDVSDIVRPGVGATNSNGSPKAVGVKTLGVKVYPNPVPVGTRVNLQIDELGKGSYTVTLFNGAAQVVSQTFAETSGGSTTQALGINRNIPKGLYRVQVKNGLKVMTQTLVIQ